MSNNTRFAIDEMRLMVRNFSIVNETFLQSFTAPELMALHRAWMSCGWDIAPDRWTGCQIWSALRGIPPMWRDDETPVAYDWRGRRGGGS